MTGAQIIDLARMLAGGITSGQISDTDMSLLLNMAYKDFYHRILSLDKNYFWDKRTADLIEDQFEYSFMSPDKATKTFGFKKPEKVRVKYFGQEDYRPVFLTDWDVMNKATPEEYALNQPKSNPFGVITDYEYIHIFPTPTQDDVTGGIIFEGAKQPYDIDKDSIETDLIIPPEYHEIVAWIMRDMMLDFRKETSEAGAAEAKAERKVQRALRQMGVLKTGAIYGSVNRNEHLE